MKKVLKSLGVLAATLLVLLGTTSPASALHNGEKLTNSSASDAAFIVYPSGLSRPGDFYIVSPGQTYTLNAGDYSPANLRVQIRDVGSFRVRNDKTSGPYGSCQYIQGDSKTFRPGDHGRVTFLLYDGAACYHA